MYQVRQGYWVLGGGEPDSAASLSSKVHKSLSEYKLIRVEEQGIGHKMNTNRR